MEEFYSAIIQCFSIIICGFLAGKMQMISKTEMHGLQIFVGKFCLPALIFVSLANLKFDKVDWLFLFAVFVSKAIVFLAVLVITVLTNKASNLLGRSGLFAIFCTQSNDFALGYPIVANIYSKTHPQYVSYIYLMAPISLLFLNPIGFVMLEIETLRTNRTTADARKSFLSIVCNIGKGVFLNPIIAMTFLGIIVNFTFKDSFPGTVTSILNVFGSAFSATALFLLGLYMVDASSAFQENSAVISVLLIITKLLVLPLVIREMTDLIHKKIGASNITDLSTFGFLYGTFPVAPSVFVFATQYMTEVNLIANSMVLCTFLSAPLMLISGKMITLRQLTPANFQKTLENYSFNIGLLGLVASIWLLFWYYLKGKCFKVPHKAMFNLTIAQVFLSTSVLLWATKKTFAIESYSLFDFYLFSIGSYATKLCVMFLAVTLLFLQCRSLCFVLKLQYIFMEVAAILPLIVATFILVIDYQTVKTATHSSNLNVQFGQYFIISNIVLLVICFLVTIGCLVLQQKYVRHLKESRNAHDSVQRQNNEIDRPSSSQVVDIEELCKAGTRSSLKNLITPSQEDIKHCEPNLMCGPRFGCSQNQCLGLVQEYEDLNENLISNDDEDDELGNLLINAQFDRHILFLVTMLSSFFVNLAYLLWYLVTKEKTGIYIEVEFLDSTLNFGQSIITCLFFGFDFDFLSKKHDINDVAVPQLADLRFETRYVCQQFVKSDMAKFVTFLRNDNKCLAINDFVFKGSDLIEWLIVEKLVLNETEAVLYGKYLMEGGLIEYENRKKLLFDPHCIYSVTSKATCT